MTSDNVLGNGMLKNGEVIKVESGVANVNVNVNVSINSSVNDNNKLTEQHVNNENISEKNNKKKKEDQSNNVTQSLKPKPKVKNKNNQLAKLLEDSMWYIESSRGNRTRESSLKFQKNKEKILEKMIKDEINNKDDEDEPSPEEKAKLEELKRKRKEKAREKLLEKRKLQEEKKLLLKKKAEERKRLIEEGKLLPRKKPTPNKNALELFTSLDADDIDSESYYKGGEVASLLKASLYFTNQGKKFDGSRREVKPVERLAQDEEYIKQLARSTKGRKLNKPKVKKSTVKRSSSSESSYEDEYEDDYKEDDHKEEYQEEEYQEEEYQEEYQEEEKKEKLVKTKIVKKEPEPTPEPEPIWFTNINDEDYIEISPEWKFFQDFVYEGKNSDFIPDGIVHAADIIRRQIKIYRTDHEVYKLQRVNLHYPFSEYKENYLLALPKDDVQFNPFDEIGKLMELTSILFLPNEAKIKVMNLDDPNDCIVGKYIKAFEENDLDNLMKCISEYNELIDNLRNNGSILKYVQNKNKFSRVAIYELLNQCYSRRVLPDSKKLSNYKAFSNEVYGELMPSFLSTVYKQCELDYKSCFIDLGSGVGNCVIQAALEFGCESYGVEIVENASILGDYQLVEFNNRCKVFGINPGFVKLFSKESFIDNPPVKKIVDKCNVILVNNYLFDNKLNKKVIELFQDLKVGCKIISLKPIVPATHKINWDNCSSILNRLKTSKFIYEENSVSWTSKGGFYYITEVMNDILEDNFVVFKSRESRRRDEGLDGRSRSDTPLNAFTNNV